MTVTNPSTRRFLRSVRLEKDAGAPNALQGYVLTPQVRGVVRRLLNGLLPGSTERAFTLTGPYGTGKSAFALFLTELVRAPQGEALRLIEQIDPALTTIVGEALPKPLLPIPLTLRRARLLDTLRDGVLSASGTLPNGAGLVGKISAVWPEGSLSTDAMLLGLQVLQEQALTAGYGGTLIVFDELGKALEHEARFEGADIYLLQELAETAARSGSAPLLFVGILHQAFEQYGEQLLASARKEWAKVQGRFADIAFIEPPEQQMRLAAQAMQDLAPPPSAELREEALLAARAIVDLGQAPPGVPNEEFVKLAGQAAPLHPATLIALPFLFRRFAQNERSLFAYLHSGEPYAATPLWTAQHRLIRLGDLFDYFSTNLLGSLSRQVFARRWLEVIDAVESSPDLDELEVQTLKTVGLLGVLGDMSTLNASGEMISLALTPASDDVAVRQALQTLEGRSLTVYRRYNRTYRVWEGSDIDIEERLEAGRMQVSAQLALSSVLENYLPRRPLVARRHSFHTGALRYFEVRYLDAPTSPTGIHASDGADGVLLCTLPGTPEQAEHFAQWAQHEDFASRPDLLVAIPQGLQSLREATLELRALHWVRENTPELRDDRVARREVAERLAFLESRLIDATGQLLDPRPTPHGSSTQFWFECELVPDISSPRQAVQLLSSALDALYPDSPRLLNELLNRRQLSSAAAAARRNLLDAMLNRADEPLLGIDPGSFPPERSMYESVLRSPGMHAPVEADDEQGPWAFKAPEPNEPTNLYPVWEFLGEAIFGAEEPLNIQELFGRLAAAPFGMTAGLQPVLLAAFLQVHPHEISLYREGAFVPEPSIADFEVLIRRAELFAVKGSRVQGARAKVVERLARGYRTQPSLVPTVRALLRGARSLPETSWRTRTLPEQVLRMREVLNQARSPEQLLFTDLPSALGLPPLDADTGSDEQVEVFFKALNSANTAWAQHAPTQTAKAQAALMNALGFPNTEDGWADLVHQASELEQRPLPVALLPFVKRLGTPGTFESVLDGVLALVAGRSPRAWTDAEAERFPTQIQAAAQTYRIAASQLGYTSPDIQGRRESYVHLVRKTLNLPVTADPSERAAARLALLDLLRELDEGSEISTEERRSSEM